MSVLSEWDIVWELGNNIYIYPFDGVHESLNGGCLRLKASEHAYIIDTQEYYKQETTDDTNIISKVIKELKKIDEYCNKVELNTDKQETTADSNIISKVIKELKKIDTIPDNNGNKYIIIPPQKTVLIWTREAIVLNGGYFCGSVHSKVTLAANSIGHIGTRVNPYWAGVLSIALHNTSDENVKVLIEKDTIAYVRFYKFKSPSFDRSSFSNASEKLANSLPKDCAVPDTLKTWVPENSWRDGNIKAIKSQLENDRKGDKAELTTYQIAKRDFWIERYNLAFLPRDKTIPWLSIIKFIILPISGAILTLIFTFLAVKYNWNWALDFLHINSVKS